MYFSLTLADTLWLQIAQLAYMIENQLKEAVEVANRKQALKDVAVATAKDKGKEAKDAEKRAREAEKAQALAEQSLTEAGEKLREMELKLAETESLSLA